MSENMQQAGPAQGAQALEELDAMKAVHTALLPLSPEARLRAMNWALGVFNVEASVTPASAKRADTDSSTDDALRRDEARAEAPARTKYTEFADLLGDAHAQTDAERALVGGYWFQVEGGAEDFTSQAINDKLKDAGQAIGNITRAMENLKDRNPQLVRQLQKSGKSQQARKRFKLTAAGIQTVERMLRGEG